MLKREQDRLFQALPKCFVRICRSDDALWVCDLPRRMQNVQEEEEKLRRLGFVCTLEDGLWKIDWTEERRNALMEAYPERLPDFPLDERYHPAYALCRLWLLHPGKQTDENLPLLRRVLKLACDKEETMLKAIPSLHETAAEHLRRAIPCAHDAGRVLCQWLNDRKEQAE